MMIPKIQCQLLEKTISTIPSIHEITNPSIHNYHQYETLLFYITSFITDFKLHIVELKELVYQFAGVSLDDYSDLHQHLFDNCEYCQVEYMMNSCRKAREDIVRVLAILRGLNRSREFKQQGFNPKFLYPYNQAVISRIKERSDNSETLRQRKKQRDNIYPHDDQLGNSYQNAQILGNNQIGFLTFRQIKVSQETNKISKIWSQQFKIQEQINQTSRSHVSAKASEFIKSQLQNNQEEKKGRKLTSSVNQINQKNYNRAFELLKLIKLQINKPAQPQESNEELSIRTKINKQFEQQTLSPTMDSPYRLDITDL